MHGGPVCHVQPDSFNSVFTSFKLNCDSPRRTQYCRWCSVLTTFTDVRWHWTVDRDYFLVSSACCVSCEVPAVVNRVWFLTLQLRAGSWMEASRVSDPLPPLSSCSPSPHKLRFFFSFERGPPHNISDFWTFGFKLVTSWTSAPQVGFLSFQVRLIYGLFSPFLISNFLLRTVFHFSEVRWLLECLMHKLKIPWVGMNISTTVL